MLFRSRTIHAGNGMGHREGLARPRDAKQHLRGISPVQSSRQLVNSPRLVASALELRDEAKVVVSRWHGKGSSYQTALWSGQPPRHQDRTEGRPAGSKKRQSVADGAAEEGL